jgi:hypothetical protein
MLNTRVSLGANYNEVNNALRQIEREQTTKTYKQPGGNAIVQGRYAEGKYGQVYYDTDNVARILIGQDPTDGHMVIAVSRDGLDVIDELEA